MIFEVSAPRPVGGRYSVMVRFFDRRCLPAVAAVLLAGLLWACGGDPQVTDPGARVATVEVLPASAELDALGATRDFEATARDRNGDPISEVTFSWSVSPDSVASVDGDGTVTARANGSATVQAEASGATGAADLTVAQKGTELTISPDSATLWTRGDTRQFEVTAHDARGNLVEDPSIVWGLADGSVATIDSSGRVTAGSEGKTEVIATTRSGSDSAASGLTVFTVDSIPVSRLVGAHYYPWYGGPDKDGDWTHESPSRPTLGAYDSRDSKIINRHVLWALEHGIQWLSMSWWGPGTWPDVTLRDHFLETELGDDIQFSILYETKGRLTDTDMNNPTNRQRLEDDLRYLSDQYFDRENYLHWNGRPVLFVYSAHLLEGPVQSAFESAMAAAGVDPYLIMDSGFASPPDRYRSSMFADAVSSYSPYTTVDDIASIFHDRFRRGTELMDFSSRVYDWSYVPVVMPGYDDTRIEHVDREDNPVLEASPDRFERVVQQAGPYFDDARAILITSFNEWFENTQVEPHEEYGEAYLRVVRDELATESHPPYRLPQGTKITFEWGKIVSPDNDLGRQLSFRVRKLELLGPDGEVVSRYDIGGPEGQEPTLFHGFYDRESDDDGGTARWFGGWGKKTTLHMEGVEQISGLRMRGWPAEKMQVTIKAGDRSTTTEVERRHPGLLDWYEFRF